MEIRLTERTPGAIYPPAESRWYLTDEHPRSSYGIPVLSNNDDDGYRGYGPADVVVVPDPKAIDFFGDKARPLTAAEIVEMWAVANVTTDEEERKIRLFLGQWPAGPQLPDDPEKLREKQKRRTEERLAAQYSSAYDTGPRL